VAPLTAFHRSVTTVPWMLATVRFVGTHDAGAVGCDVVVDVDEGPVGDVPALSELPHAPVTAAASVIDKIPARFIACSFTRTLNSAPTHHIRRQTPHAAGTIRPWAMAMPEAVLCQHPSDLHFTVTDRPAIRVSWSKAAYEFGGSDSESSS
jgi:hypothetical protein